MSVGLSGIFSELGHILGVCPCCSEIFYLSEARPFMRGKRPRWIVDTLRTTETRLDQAAEKLDEIENALRVKAAAAGLKNAKKLLKKIDPVFSGAGYDPQDVKVIFSPVTYVVFDGMAKSKLKKITLLAKPPEDSGAERIQKSIQSAVKNGNYEFKTLHVDGEGKVISR